MALPVVLVVAVSENGVIGRAGGMPWRLSGDLRHFKAVTMGKPIVMGRKTFQAIGRPLPGRPNIVVTRDPGFAPPGVEVTDDLDRALARAQDLAAASGAEEVAVVGGGEIYREALGRADRVYLTEVHASLEGDTRFPDLDPREWREVSRSRHPAGERDEFDYSFVVLQRITKP